MVRVLQKAIRDARVFDSPQSLAYWAYHVSRMGFFATQGLAGNGLVQGTIPTIHKAEPT